MGNDGIRLYRWQRAVQRVVLVVVVLVAGTGVAFAQGRAAVPDDAAQSKARELLQELYGKEFESAQASAQKTALAKKMLGQAAETKGDPASHFVLLRVAKDVAVLAGDVETALGAVNRIAAIYDVDAMEMKEETFHAVASAARISSQFKAIAQQALPLIEEAVALDEYEKADRFGESGSSLARRAREYVLLKQIVERRKEVGELAQAYAEARKAQELLEENPTEPDANLTVGRYLCLVKGEWAKGVPMLALGGDAQLKAVARKELMGAASADEKVALGDQWWELAQVQQGDVRKSMMLRAGSWYQAAQEGISGLIKIKIDRRLEEIATIGAVELPSDFRQQVFKFDDEAFTAKYWLWNDQWTMADEGGKAPSGPQSFLRTRHGYKGDLSIDMDFSFGQAKFSNTGGCWITVWGQKLVISNDWRPLTARINVHREGDQIVFVHNGQQSRIPVERSVWSKPTIIEVHWRSRTSHFRRIEIKAQSVVGTVTKTTRSRTWSTWLASMLTSLSPMRETHHWRI